MNDEEILQELKEFVAFHYSYDIAMRIIQIPSDEYAGWVEQTQREFIAIRARIYRFIMENW